MKQYRCPFTLPVSELSASARFETYLPECLGAQWTGTTQHTWRSLPGRKQGKLFLQMEMVSIWSAWKFFGSCPGLSSWRSLLPTAPQTSWDFLVRISVNIAFKMMFFDVSNTFWHFSLKILTCLFFFRLSSFQGQHLHPLRSCILL